MSGKEKIDFAADDLANAAIEALQNIDVGALSFLQLRRLNAALMHASEVVTDETARRSDDEASGDTVRISVPPDPAR